MFSHATCCCCQTVGSYTGSQAANNSHSLLTINIIGFFKPQSIPMTSPGLLEPLSKLQNKLEHATFYIGCQVGNEYTINGL